MNIRGNYTEVASGKRKWTVMQATSGLVLVAVAWSLSWGGSGHFRYHTFFPLWLGYILIVDTLSLFIADTSLLRRLGRRTVWLFLLSVPLWWVFEAVNSRLDNWIYHLPYDYSWLAYHLEASLAFSTVVPAVLVTAELVRTLMIPGKLHWIRLTPSCRVLYFIMATGVAMLLATLFWPDIFFPLTWISLFLVCDPLSALIGGRSITVQVRVKRWDTVLVVFAATLICGIFWEMWNVRAIPKWEYTIPWADWLHVFEMPILGFGGYLPFGLEIYAFVNLVDHLLKLRLGDHFLFDHPQPEF